MSIISLRNTIKGPVGRILMAGVFLTMFGGFGLSRIFMKFFKGGSFDGVALVNGIDISRQTFQAAVAQEDQRISAIRQKYGQNADLYMQMIGMNTNPQVNAFNSVVYAALLDDLATKLHLVLSDEYIESRFADPRFLMQEFGHLLPRDILFKDGNFNTFGILQFLRQTGQIEAIKADLKEKLAKEFALVIVSSAFFVPQSMIKQMFIEKKIGKKFSYQTLSLENFIKAEKSNGASDEQLTAFYKEQNSINKRYWNSEERTGSVWTFTPESYGITVTSEEIETYYAKNKSTRFIKEPVQVKVREIVMGDLVERGLATVKEEADAVHAQLVQDPNSFESLAKQYATKKEKTAASSWIKRGDKDKEYEKAAFKLKEDGEISPVITTKDALVIVQRVERKDATFESLEKVRPDIIKIITDQKFRVEFTRQANQISRQDDVQKALENFVQNHKGTKSELKDVKKDASDMSIQRLFASKNKGDISAFVKEGKGLIVQYTQSIPAQVATFESVRAQVADDYYESKGTKALEAAVKKAKEQSILQKKMVIAPEGKISSTDWIKADQEEKIEKLVALGFPQGFMELDWQGAVLSTFTKDGGIIIRLDDMQELKNEDFESQKKEVMKEAFERNRALFLQSFIASLFRNATIKANDELSRVKDQV